MMRKRCCGAIAQRVDARCKRKRYAMPALPYASARGARADAMRDMLMPDDAMY